MATLPEDIKARLDGLTAAIASRTGRLSDLATATKTTLAAAINEVHALASTAASTAAGLISDTTNSTSTTWSSDKIISYAADVKASILGGVLPEAFDTLRELLDQQITDGTAIGNLLAAVSKRVRFDEAQVLTALEQTQARDNIGAAAAADFGVLNADYGAAFLAATA